MTEPANDMSTENDTQQIDTSAEDAKDYESELMTVRRRAAEVFEDNKTIAVELLNVTAERDALKADLSYVREACGSAVLAQHSAVMRAEAAEVDRDRLRAALEAVLEVWDSEIIQGRLAYLAFRSGGGDGTDEERAFIKERIDQGREALHPSRA